MTTEPVIPIPTTLTGIVETEYEPMIQTIRTMWDKTVEVRGRGVHTGRTSAVSREDPRYADYYAIKDRQDAIVAEGGCSCCASIAGRVPAPARYRWENTNGNVSHLCESCCRHWRQFAAEDPALLPQQLRSL